MGDSPNSLLTRVPITDIPDPPSPHYTRQSSTASPLVYSRDFAYADNGPVIVLPARMAATDITNASAKTFAQLLSGPTVDIYVGPQKLHWSLHQNLLGHHSSYCELKFHSHEALQKTNNKLELPEHDPMGFELLVKWLYQGTLEDSSSFETNEAKYDHAVACHKLWLLCDRFEMVKLKNLAMDQYRRCLNDSHLVPDADEINDIYRTSPVGSPFRHLMVKIAARQIMDPETERDAETYRKCFEANPDFAIKMISSIRQSSHGILFTDPTRGDACSYHDHADVSGCPMQGKGKARAPKTSDPGPSAQAARQLRPSSPLVHVELSTENPTPHKLLTPFKTPSAGQKAGATGTPKTVPPKLNGTGSRLAVQSTRRSISSDDTPFHHDPPHPASDQTPRMLPSATLPASGVSTGSIIYEPSIKEAGHCANGIEPSNRMAHDIESDRHSIIASASSPACKRKLGDRTPRKLRAKPPVAVLVAQNESNRKEASGMSGPRKLRVSSIVRRFNESSCAEEAQGKEAKKQPLKLRKARAPV